MFMTIELIKEDDCSSQEKRRIEKMTNQEKGFLKRIQRARGE